MSGRIELVLGMEASFNLCGTLCCKKIQAGLSTKEGYFLLELRSKLCTLKIPAPDPVTALRCKKVVHGVMRGSRDGVCARQVRSWWAC